MALYTTGVNVFCRSSHLIILKVFQLGLLRDKDIRNDMKPEIHLFLMILTAMLCDGSWLEGFVVDRKVKNSN